MHITILGSGTSQGVPVIACPCDVCKSTDPLDKRLRSSIMVETDTTCIVIDAGPDFRQQMLRENVKRVDAIFITHEHKDHTAGLDDVRSFNYLYKCPMKIYASPQTQESLKLEYSYVFKKNCYPGIPEFDLISLDETPVTVGNICVQPIEVLHMFLKVFAFRINNFAYVTDTNYISPESFNKLKGTEYLVIDALRKEPHLSHFDLEQAISVSQKIGAKKTWFTHISHLMGKSKDIEPLLPDSMFFAYDGMTIDL